MSTTSGSNACSRKRAATTTTIAPGSIRMKKTARKSLAKLWDKEQLQQEEDPFKAGGSDSDFELDEPKFDLLQLPVGSSILVKGGFKRGMWYEARVFKHIGRERLIIQWESNRQKRMINIREVREKVVDALDRKSRHRAKPNRLSNMQPVGKTYVNLVNSEATTQTSDPPPKVHIKSSSNHHDRDTSCGEESQCTKRKESIRAEAEDSPSSDNVDNFDSCTDHSSASPSETSDDDKSDSEDSDMLPGMTIQEALKTIDGDTHKDYSGDSSTSSIRGGEVKPPVAKAVNVIEVIRKIHFSFSGYNDADEHEGGDQPDESDDAASDLISQE